MQLSQSNSTSSHSDAALQHEHSFDSEGQLSVAACGILIVGALVDMLMFGYARRHADSAVARKMGCCASGMLLGGGHQLTLPPIQRPDFLDTASVSPPELATGAHSTAALTQPETPSLSQLESVRCLTMLLCRLAAALRLVCHGMPLTALVAYAGHSSARGVCPRRRTASA